MRGPSKSTEVARCGLMWFIHTSGGGDGTGRRTMRRFALLIGLGLATLTGPAFAQFRHTSAKAEVCRQETRSAIHWDRTARFHPRTEDERRAYFRHCMRSYARM